MSLENEELQADEAPIEEIQTDADDANPADEATAENEDAAQAEEPVKFDERQQKVFNEAIGKKVSGQRAAEREAGALRRELDELKASAPVEQRPVIPEAPDPYADDYEAQVQARDEKIIAASAFDKEQEIVARQTKDRAQQVQQQQIQTLQETVTTYTERAKTSGMTAKELKSAGDAVSAHGVSNDVVHHILMDEAGPSITKYLADNPLAMDALNGLTPMQAAVHIETVIKPVAVSPKRTTNAPPPETTLEGGGTPPSERGPKGATFE